MRKLWFLWSAIAWISTALCTAGCVLPYWLKGTIYTGINEQLAVAMGLHMTRLPSTLGLYRRCVYPVYTDKMNEALSANQDADSRPGHYVQTTEQARLIRIRAGCGFYQFEQIPHSIWQAALMLLSLACVLLWFISFFLLFVGCYVGLLNYPTLTRACQALLLVSGHFNQGHRSSRWFGDKVRENRSLNEQMRGCEGLVKLMDEFERMIKAAHVGT
ncbi:hypothetical protein X801_00782 [Opisthorchis viverrini]|uniref:Uncharacterized protein n=1 Tax=Opisthorchis viverrini TaxID=6198 RepID=A0A1S8X9E9_OPIVI|nr:hypothetical protein X801_00782 [Opisthorchis viverrini]